MAYDVEAVVPERMRTRQRILEAALELFRTEGFDGASLRQLADQLQFTPAALYYHFASKADILLAVVAPLLDDLDAVLEDDFSTGGRSADRRRLSRLLDVLLDHRDIVTLLARDVTASRMVVSLGLVYWRVFPPNTGTSEKPLLWTATTVPSVSHETDRWPPACFEVLTSC